MRKLLDKIEKRIDEIEEDVEILKKEQLEDEVYDALAKIKMFKEKIDDRSYGNYFFEILARYIRNRNYLGEKIEVFTGVQGFELRRNFVKELREDFFHIIKEEIEKMNFKQNFFKYNVYPESERIRHVVSGKKGATYISKEEEKTIYQSFKNLMIELIAHYFEFISEEELDENVFPYVKEILSLPYTVYGEEKTIKDYFGFLCDHKSDFLIEKAREWYQESGYTFIEEKFSYYTNKGCLRLLNDKQKQTAKEKYFSHLEKETNKAIEERDLLVQYRMLERIKKEILLFDDY